MGLWPRTPLRDATWNNITAHARYLIDTHQIVVDAQGRTVTWRHRNVGKLQTVIHKLEKAFPVLERAHGHWIALTICQHHAKVVNEATRKAKVYREKTTAAAPQDDDLSNAHDVVHGASSARVDDENTRCETPASVLSEDDDIDEAASRVVVAANFVSAQCEPIMGRKHWLTRCSVKQTRMCMFPRQVRPIFDVIRLTSGQKSSKDRSTSSSRKVYTSAIPTMTY
ncbi:hypothetical protein BCR37DRAFT_388603 [Protomyces lactucae-debilis]|uniref:Uncharacterized protein n=1 Tax=Protomyces lactucae-debilis TaxID=2754530 RepID=A0A1Y2F5Q6_PROLT|nr:uncharacterized protein BCR37DRAFT_388603 [Protomyces lactucae-debilis]ORY78987.1 hypothetical protein BCR37DRAFT_388603 [Protomyces lactucae-debilis]